MLNRSLFRTPTITRIERLLTIHTLVSWGHPKKIQIRRLVCRVLSRRVRLPLPLVLVICHVQRMLGRSRLHGHAGSFELDVIEVSEPGLRNGRHVRAVRWLRKQSRERGVCLVWLTAEWKEDGLLRRDGQYISGYNLQGELVFLKVFTWQVIAESWSRSHLSSTAAICWQKQVEVCYRTWTEGAGRSVWLIGSAITICETDVNATVLRRSLLNNNETGGQTGTLRIIPIESEEASFESAKRNLAVLWTVILFIFRKNITYSARN